jgi:ATP-dependent RNA helicase DeaD
VTPKMIINLINEHMSERNIDIGRIDIQKSHSYFEIDSRYKTELLEAFEETPYEGLIVKEEFGRSDEGGYGRSRDRFESRREDRGSRGGDRYDRDRKSSYGDRNSKGGRSDRQDRNSSRHNSSTSSDKGKRRDYSEIEKKTDSGYRKR